MRRRTTIRSAASARRASRASSLVQIKRAYDAPEASDGYRVLVDRLWPRGVRKEALHLDAWMKEVGPSDDLRRWFGHDPSRWEAFADRYRSELRSEPAATHVEELVALARRGPLTLVYGAKDELHNQAVVLADRIRDELARPRARAARPSPRRPRA